MKTALIGGGILGAAYVAAGLLYAKKNQTEINRLAGGPVGTLSAVLQWPAWMFRQRKATQVAAVKGETLPAYVSNFKVGDGVRLPR